MTNDQLQAIKKRCEAAKYSHDHDYWHDKCWMCQADKERHEKADIPALLAEVERTQAFDALVTLLKAAKCPCCDGSGGYYTNDGEPAQCQWCHETKAALNLAEGE